MAGFPRGRAFTVAAGILGLLALSGCVEGNGPVVSELRDIRPFSRLEVGSGIRVEATIGDSTGLAVRAQQNILPMVATEVTGTTLTVEARDDFTSAEPVTVVVSTGSLQAVSMSGGAVLHVDQLDGDTIDLDARGGSQLTISGTAGHVSLMADGGSVVDLANLSARLFEVTVGGGATASVRASERVTGSASGGASLSVAGSGSVEVTATGGASVARR
jgi:hypothetical protein